VKYVDEYRREEDARKFLEAIRRTVQRPHTVMELCGGQTHTLIRSGIDRLLPPAVEVVHGPGCPVCVTPLALIDRAIAIAGRPGVILTSFGDMLRVPGSRADLLGARAAGADVRIVYSPLDAVELAAAWPDREVVFFAVGFETTAPANAAAVAEAARRGLGNFSILSAQVLVPPALEAILGSPGNRVTGFLAAGHVCAVTGFAAYEPLAERHRVPIVVTGFEPLDLLQGLYMLLQALEQGRCGVENQYARAVRRTGNLAAQALVREVFEVCDRTWRGIGEIPRSGLRLREAYRAYDAERRFDVAAPAAAESPSCIAGEVLQGRRKPDQCPQFGTACTPATPLGAPMVSGEGACAAYHRYGRGR